VGPGQNGFWMPIFYIISDFIIDFSSMGGLILLWLLILSFWRPPRMCLPRATALVARP